MIKADLHIHTEYSMDCTTPLDKIVERCLELKINCIAVADHGTIEGAVKLREIAPFTVITAEEILTPDGEVMGMFLAESIRSGTSISEVISEIRAQNGYICIPHPFDIFRPSALGNKILDEIADQIDIIEVFNARTLPFQSHEKAISFAKKYGINMSAGSDAHTLQEIGNAYVEMPEFTSQDDFFVSLSQVKINGRKTNPMIHFISLKNKILKRLS
ncbi:MAG: PHP domain-containing protein [Dehalococcoidia bacterium]|nr:MAG: PHP domain-containing protein [Dehalococcoidia bacterium]